MRTGSAAILIGTDCPDLQPDYLCKARDKLDQGADVVLGPAHDGGYVLIALRRLRPFLFEDIPWGSSEVLAATREKMRQSGLRWSELPVLHDLDRPEDLELYPDLADRVLRNYKNEIAVRL